VRSVRALILGGLVIVSVSLASCDMVGERGSGNLTTQPVTLDGDVDRVEVGSAFWVRVTVGAPEPQAEVTIDDNLVDRLRVRQEGSTLVVEIDGSVQNATMRALVSLPSLRGVRASGASTIEVVGEATGDLEAEASGASTIEATGIDLDRFGVDVSGASRVEADGEASVLEADVSGASSLASFGLRVGSATLDVSGASSAEVEATDDLRVDASGASNVRFTGTADVDVDASGGSTVAPA
jgi:hypothetical protein